MKEEGGGRNGEGGGGHYGDEGGRLGVVWRGGHCGDEGGRLGVVWRGSIIVMDGSDFSPITQLEKPFREKAAEKASELALNAQRERVEGVLKVCMCVGVCGVWACVVCGRMWCVVICVDHSFGC